MRQASCTQVGTSSPSHRSAHSKEIREFVTPGHAMEHGTVGTESIRTLEKGMKNLTSSSTITEMKNPFFQKPNAS
jgi:hypothetical protein